jgi:hypothetical protein
MRHFQWGRNPYFRSSFGISIGKRWLNFYWRVPSESVEPEVSS